MTSAQGIRAGAAYVELYANDNRLVRGLRRAEARLQAFGGTVRQLGLGISSVTAAIFAPLGALSIKAASDAQEQLSRFEQVFGDQADAAKAFADTLAREVGRSKFAILDVLATFQAFFVGLGFDPSKARELSQTLQRLAIDFASFNNLSDEEAIQKFISALSGSSEVLNRFGVNIKQAALEQELLRMGVRKSWSEVTEQEKALARLNIIMRSMGDQGAVGDAVRTAGSFANRMKALRGQLHDTAVEIGRALLPVVTPLVERFTNVVRVAAEWIKTNGRLVATVFTVAAAVAAGGIALVGLGFAISGLGAVMGVIGAVISGVGTAIGILGSVLAALISPIGLVVAAVVGLGAVLLHTTGAGAEALSWLGDRFGRLRDTAATVFRGIADALAAGDIALAAKILWLGLELAWHKGVAALSAVWLQAKQFFVGTAQKMWFGALAAAQIGFHALEVAWIETTAFLSKTWTRFTSAFQGTWETATSFVAKRMLEIQGLFDKGLDVEAAKKAVDEDLERRLGEIDVEGRGRVEVRERQRQREREKSRELNDATLDEIGRQFEEAQKALDEGTSKKIEQTKKALEDARRELDEAIAEAARKRAAPARGEGPPSPGMTDDLLARVQSQLAGLGDSLAERITVRGTFNAAAVRGLEMADEASERTAKATEETARNTKRLVDASRAGGLRFA